MARRKRLILTEFVVTVLEDRVDWGGAESFLCRLLNAKPAGGFLPHLWATRRQDRRQASSKSK